MMTLEKVFKCAVKPLVGTGIGRIKPLADLYQKIAIRVIPSEQVIDVQGFKMEVVTEGHIPDITTELLFKGVHEPVSTQMFKDLIRDGDRVVDVGANIGYFSLLASNLVGDEGSVYCFEPSSDNCKKLLRNIELNNRSNISVHQMAISNKNGNATFYLSSREDARHSLIRTMEHDCHEDVVVKKLDDVLVGRVDFLKIDTEGNDFQVLQGAREIINQNRNIKILFEVYGDVLSHQKISLTNVWDYLSEVLCMKYIYYVDDYKGDKPERISIATLQKDINRSGLACNLLCSREAIGVYE